MPQRVRQLHRLAIAERAALELAGEIGDAAAPAVFIGEVVHNLGHGHAGADDVGLDLVAIGFGKHAEMSRFPRLWTGPEKGTFSMVELARFYGVSTDYLLGLTEQKNHPDTELDALHLGDDAIEVLRAGKFNHRLLSELICHKDFQQFMLDTEIYVDRIADMRVNDMNAVLEAVRQMALMKNGGEENDLYLRTLEVAQIREDEYFGSLIADDLKDILRDIRGQHRPDTMTADESSLAATVQGQLQDAMNFEGSSEEKKIRAFLATFGIDYDKLSKEQFVSLIEILKLSKHMKSPINQRGKARPQLQHGTGRKKRK